MKYYDSKAELDYVSLYCLFINLAICRISFANVLRTFYSHC